MRINRLRYTTQRNFIVYSWIVCNCVLQHFLDTTCSCASRYVYVYIMQLAHCSCAGLQCVCANARTGSKQHYSNNSVDVISAHQVGKLHRGSAGWARCVSIFWRNQDVVAPARVFNILNIFPRRTLVVIDAARWLADTTSAFCCRTRPSHLCRSSTAVSLCYVGSVRRLELAETGTLFPLSTQPRISCCVEAAPVAPGDSLFPEKPGCNCPCAVFNTLNICLRSALFVTERKWRNRRNRRNRRS